ncbi:MAG: homogentisate 1,2-dioxygenase, partial [Gammaproteobacteria bacterium]
MPDQPTTYQSGFGNEFATESVPGALPQGRNSPQKPPLGLYPELISGTAFTAPRAANHRTWFYRIQPSVVQGRMTPCSVPHWLTAPLAASRMSAEALRWGPLPMPDDNTDFIDGIRTMATNGDANGRTGMAVLLY